MAYSPSIGTTLPLLKGRISVSDALAEDEDIIQELTYPEKRLDFWLYLFDRRSQIEEVVSRHLNISRSEFRLGEVEEWIHGSFNACIPIHITANTLNSNLPKRAIIRFPLPYKIGEEYHPGNVDEKLRCEAATYIWLQKYCSTVPVPRLLAFGFPGVQSFTALSNESIYNQISWYFRYSFARIFGNILPPYFSHHRQSLLDLGYLIIEYVDQGRMLSESWDEHSSNPERRANLFRGLPQVMLGLAKHPLPRIGSWTMNNQGILSLTNRPLTLSLHQQENLRIPTEIPRCLTYSSVEPYFLDLLACQDGRLRHQPNSIHNEDDGKAQLAALTAMRAFLPRFTNRSLRGGPFALSLTDLHQSNIFVDDEWRITKIIDLEWACVRPIEMLGPPHWLSGRSREQLAFHLEEYTKLHQEFVDVLEEEEMACYNSNEYSQIIRACWKTGTFWYAQALDCPSALLALFTDHLQPRFAKLNSTSREEFNRVLSPFWDFNSIDFISTKTREQKLYSHRILEIFSVAAEENSEKSNNVESMDNIAVGIIE